MAVSRPFGVAGVLVGHLAVGVCRLGLSVLRERTVGDGRRWGLTCKLMLFGLLSELP
jgi:hypothetical protein